jgi:hypothetical protein
MCDTVCVFFFADTILIMHESIIGIAFKLDLFEQNH